jgi:hypothetical protein
LRLLHEYRALEFAPASKRVDREQGIIYGVKVVGRHSPNKHEIKDVSGTDYTLEALEEEKQLLEGINVNVDHPDRKQPSKERSARDRFAWLEEVRLTDDGIFADLHFLDPTDPLAIKMLNAAEKHPSAYALSHNAWGQGEVRNGRYVVTHIPEVRSVDIVADGGTNRSLFEGQEDRIMKKKFRTIIEAASPAVQKRFARLLEDAALGGAIGDMEADEPAAPEGDDAGYEDHLAEMVKAIVLDSSLSPADKIAKIKSALKLLEQQDEDNGEGKEEEEDVPEGASCPPGQKAMESRLAELERKDACRELCEAENFWPSKTQLKALMALDTLADRKTLLKELKESRKTSGARSRSLHTEPARESHASDIPAKPADQLAWLRD